MMIWKSNRLSDLLALLVPLVLIAPVGWPHAETAVSAEADHLVELLRYKDQLEAAKQNCLASDRAISTEEFQKTNPDYFGEITPGDRRWPKALNAYAEYVKMLCEHPTVSESLALMSEKYGSVLSKDDLRASVMFYSSATGSRLVAIHREIAAALFKASQEARAEYAPEATALLRERIRQILRDDRPSEGPSFAGVWIALRDFVNRSYNPYFFAELLFAAGFLLLGFRQRSAGLIVAAVSFLVVFLAQVELSSVGQVLDDARKHGADLVPYHTLRDTWKFASAIGYITAALGVFSTAVRSWVQRKVA